MLGFENQYEQVAKKGDEGLVQQDDMLVLEEGVNRLDYGKEENDESEKTQEKVFVDVKIYHVQSFKNRMDQTMFSIEINVVRINEPLSAEMVFDHLLSEIKTTMTIFGPDLQEIPLEPWVEICQDQLIAEKERHNFAKEFKVSETVTSMSKVETSNSKTNNDKVEMSKIKSVRMSEPIIEEWFVLPVVCLYCQREISTASIRRTVVTRVNTASLIFEGRLVLPVHVNAAITKVSAAKGKLGSEKAVSSKPESFGYQSPMLIVGILDLMRQTTGIQFRQKHNSTYLFNLFLSEVILDMDVIGTGYAGTGLHKMGSWLPLGHQYIGMIWVTNHLVALRTLLLSKHTHEQSYSFHRATGATLCGQEGAVTVGLSVACTGNFDTTGVISIE
ncbi:hypothetical protein Tco_1548794 [Tanacetum coccineum]